MYKIGDGFRCINSSNPRIVIGEIYEVGGIRDDCIIIRDTTNMRLAVASMSISEFEKDFVFAYEGGYKKEDVFFFVEEDEDEDEESEQEV